MNVPSIIAYNGGSVNLLSRQAGLRRSQEVEGNLDQSACIEMTKRQVQTQFAFRLPQSVEAGPSI